MSQKNNQPGNKSASESTEAQLDAANLDQALRKIMAPDRLEGKDCSLDLYLYASGQMNAEEASRFERHIAECRQCKADLEVFQKMKK